MLSISKPAEKCSYRNTGRLRSLKWKDWSKRGGGVPQPVPWSPQQTIPDHRLYLSSSKNVSAEHIHALSICLTRTNTLTHTVTHSHSLSLSLALTLSHTHTHTHTHTHSHTYTYTHTHSRKKGHILKPWICSAEEFLELIGKVEAVARNCLLRSSGHLVEVAGTPYSISLFAINILAFFLLR